MAGESETQKEAEEQPRVYSHKRGTIRYSQAMDLKKIGITAVTYLRRMGYDDEAGFNAHQDTRNKVFGNEEDSPGIILQRPNVVYKKILKAVIIFAAIHAVASGRLDRITIFGMSFSNFNVTEIYVIFKLYLCYLWLQILYYLFVFTFAPNPFSNVRAGDFLNVFRMYNRYIYSSPVYKRIFEAREKRFSKPVPEEIIRRAKFGYRYESGRNAPSSWLKRNMLFSEGIIRLFVYFLPAIILPLLAIIASYFGFTLQPGLIECTPIAGTPCPVQESAIMNWLTGWMDWFSLP